MKPQFLFNAGTGWSATTPFYYTVTQSRYCHSGHQKENGFFKYLSKTGDNQKRYQLRKDRLDLDDDWVKTVNNSHYVNLDDVHDLYSQPNLGLNSESIAHFIKFYLKLYEAVKKDYHAVSDFSNYNFELPEEFLVLLRDQMSEHFDVRITFQFRDPIRRYFSEVGKFIQHKLILPGISSHKIKHNAFVKAKEHIKLFKYYLSNIPIFAPAYYTQNIEKFKRVFGEERVLPIIMEEFWNPERKAEQCERLSDFLNYKIDSIHENVYYPDMGTKAPRHEGLPDQYGSDFEDLTPQLYEWAKQYLGFVYSDWEKCYGSLPDEWDQPTIKYRQLKRQ